MEFTMFETK